MSRSTVIDLADFYRAQGAKAERERIVSWLDRVFSEIEKDESLPVEEAGAALGLIVVLREELTK